MGIRFFDMFSGIGGFRSGLEAVGGFECIGHCEIDKHANQAYNAIYDIKPQEVYFEDARKINPYDLPHIDLICGGFPCQAFSIAGRRGGFEDSRGTLFFEIARIAAVKRPSYLLLENVPGLLSHDGGRTFATILGTLSDLGYDVTWEVLNSKDFGVPQSRKRVYIIGYFRGRCSGEILSFRETNAKTLMQIIPGREGNRIYSPSGVAITLTSNAGGFGGKTGLYDINAPVKIRTADGVKLVYPPIRHGRKYSFIDTVDTFDEQRVKELMDEKSKLQQQLAQIAERKQKRENTKSRLDEIFTILDGIKNRPMEYDDRLVRQIIECVVVESKERIKVVFVGGLEITETLINNI